MRLLSNQWGITTVLKASSRIGKLSDRSNQKMQSQLHFELLSLPMADIDSHAQLIPHLQTSSSYS